MSVQFEDYSIDVKNIINDNIAAFLHEAGGEVQAEAMRNSRVDTGQTKGQYDYVVDEEKGECIVGNPLENAIWEEFGTGEYAFKGNGRKGGWFYKDKKGKWQHTYGKTPNHTLERAFNAKKNTIKKIAESKFGGTKS